MLQSHLLRLCHNTPIHHRANRGECILAHVPGIASDRPGTWIAHLTRIPSLELSLSTAVESEPRVDSIPSTPLRILFCIDNFGIGGTELNAVRTAEALSGRVALRVASLQTDGALRERYERAGVPVDDFPLRNLYGPAAMRAGLAFARLVREWKPGVVHCHDIYTNIFCGFWARVGGARAVIASRRWGVDSSVPKLDGLNRIASQCATRLLTNGSDGLRTSAASAQPGSIRVVLLPNFLEPAAFEAASDAEIRLWRSSYGIPPESILVGVVARLAPVKHHELAIEAIARVRRSGRPAHLALVGDGPSRAKLEALVASRGLEGAVTFTGTLANRPVPQRNFDIAALSSKSEGFANSLIEAMAVARPVVATDVGGVRDAVEHGVTGLLVGAEDEVGFAEAICRLIDNEALRRTMGEAGRARARALFEQQVVMEKLLHLYRELAA